MKAMLLISTLLIFTILAKAQETTVILYPEKVPGEISNTIEEKVEFDGEITRISFVKNPSITIYPPKNKTTDAVVVICPGGGYGILAYDHEGTKIAQWFNERGMTVVVLKYRLPEDDLFENSKIRPLQDAQTAIRYVRQNADKLGVSKNNIGIMGFSAGGHLAATASTLFNGQLKDLPKEATSARPDFSILIYPVISMDDKVTHTGSKENLIGKKPTLEDQNLFSPDKQVSTETPPTFLLSTTDDFVVPENSILYYLACKENKVPVEMHIFERGGHGYALTKKNRGPVENWPILLENWLKTHEILKF